MKKNFFLTLIIVMLFISNNLYSFINYSGGDGSEENPFILSKPADIDQLMSSYEDWDSYFVVTNNINCSGLIWAQGNPNPIGNYSYPFTGNFDGRNHIISNISINHGSFLGFFGYISNANIRNLGLENINITGVTQGYGGGYGGSFIAGFAAGDCIGLFCGYAVNSYINKCYSSGNASGRFYIGGFCGSLESGVFTNCYSLGNVSGRDYVGGFCGSFGLVYNPFLGGANAVIAKCYSISEPTASEADPVLGGFIGEYYSGTLECNFWGFSGADLEDTGNNSDMEIGRAHV